MNLMNSFELSDNNTLFLCVAHHSEGRDFHFLHNWKQRRRFGIFIYYRCMNCGKTITKEQYEKIDKIFDVLL